MLNNTLNRFSSFPKPLVGDYVAIVLCLFITATLFHFFWQTAPASVLRIRVGNQIYGEYSLMQHKTLTLNGRLGQATIAIQNGQVRFLHAPCSNQYCVHQGWLKKAGQVSICLPNQISLELMGKSKPFDTLNY
jgi:hypothetical protein